MVTHSDAMLKWLTSKLICSLPQKGFEMSRKSDGKSHQVEWAANRIIVVGDLHGEWGKLNELITKKRPDIILQCGDFGWWPKMEIKYPILYGRKNNWKLKGIKPRDSKVYWCDGNHEEYPHLSQDGKIIKMYHNVLHCQRGATLTLPDGRVVLFAGGASSVDKHLRTSGHDWFPEENITERDLDRMLSHEHIDIVISHTCPMQFDIHGIGLSDKSRDSNRVALDYVLSKYKPDLWFFGHWHTDEKGEVNNTYWHCLDYPGHHGRWWMELP